MSPKEMRQKMRGKSKELKADRRRLLKEAQYLIKKAKSGEITKEEITRFQQITELFNS